MKSVIKAVIFDWGDVVAPNKNGGWVEQLAKLLDIDFNKALDLWRESSPGLSTGAVSEQDFWNFVSLKTKKELPNKKNEIWFKGLADKPYPEILDLVAKLKTSGIKVVVLSNTIEPMERMAYLDEMYKDFDFVFLSHRVGLAKPDPKFYEFALNKLGVQPHESIFIDDSNKNIESAKKLGINTIQNENNPFAVVQAIQKYL